MGRQVWCLLKVKVHVCKVWSYFSMHACYADKSEGMCVCVYIHIFPTCILCMYVSVSQHMCAHSCMCVKAGVCYF